MDQIKRIELMESYLNETEPVIRELSQALHKYEEIRDKYHKLEEYYGSPQWMADYEADEAGKFPDGLRRGVLSEDALYDLITEHSELMTRMAAQTGSVEV
jgi:hypothetical protein